MNRKRCSEAFFSLLVMALAVALAGCGGGGGGDSTVAPAPAPVPAPTAPLGNVGSNQEEQTRLYEVLLDEFISPDHSVFASATDALAGTIDEFCASPSRGTAEDMQTGWADAMDAWQRVQWLRTGPVEQSNRRLRIQFFPDANNIVEQAVDQRLAGSEVITEDDIAQSSVGVQGLPALEHLLFSIGDLDDAVAGSRRCELATAVAQNLRTMAAELDVEWSATGSNRADFATSGGRFIDGDGVLTEVLESIAVQVEFAADRKLGDALLSSLSSNLEVPRARRSTDALRVNLELLDELFDDAIDTTYRLNDYLERVHEAGSVTAIMSEQIGLAQSGLAALPASLESVVEGESEGDLESIRQALQRLADAIENAAISAGVTIGFNNLDGD